MVLVLCAICIFGTSYTKSTGDISGISRLTVSLGWSYWLAVTGGIVMLINSVLTVWLVRMVSTRNLGYEEL